MGQTAGCNFQVTDLEHTTLLKVMQEMMMELGRVTREAILESGKSRCT